MVVIYSKHRHNGLNYIDYLHWLDTDKGTIGILPHDISWWLVPGTFELEN